MAMDFGSSLRHYRKKAVLTQRELAVLLGKQQSWIAAIEKGIIKPNIFDVKRIANHLGVTLSDLL
jgi:transcriptional regulator with XRE-family HTH domain